MGRPKRDIMHTTIELFLDALSAVRTLHHQRHGAVSWLRLDLSMRQLKATMTLVAQGPIPAGELAATLGIAPSAATPLVDQLCELGLAQREPDEADRRVTRVRATPEAQALRDRLMNSNREVLLELLDHLTVRELGALETGLAALVSAAEQNQRPAEARAQVAS